MWIRFAKFPWWLWALVVAVSYAGWLTVVTVWIDDLSWHKTLMQLPGSIIVGLIVGPVCARGYKQRLAVVQYLPEDKVEAAERASRRGPVPSDPETHAGALTLAEHRLGVIERGFITRNVVMCVVLVCGVAISVFGTLWFSLPTVLFAVAVADTVRQRSQFTRRVALLADGFVR